MTELRYTVELTTEGWQIKDRAGKFLAGSFNSREAAEIEASSVEAYENFDDLLDEPSFARSH